jgi:argininosuccinate lyase
VKFSPDYVRIVLNENFEDAKAQFLAPLMAINYAHLVMLTEQGIVTRAEGGAIRRSLDAIDLESVRAIEYDGTYEDLFFYLERLVSGGCGDEASGRLHTARSRNDIDMTMYRMQQRQWVLGVIASTLVLRGALIPLAARYRDAVFPAHTHTQPAQPSTIAHYLQAVIEQLERDTVRLQAAYRTTNQSPLGACAITGTGFPIDRARTANLLGFDGTTGNTYGSIATVDYLLESVSATSVLLVGLGRVVQDLLLWCTMEFGYLRLADGFVQGSSIMPQKRNPVALEHARAIASKAVGQAAGLMLAAHNTPFGDIVDTEDDIQPLVAQMFKDATRAASLVASAMEHAEFDVERLAARAGEHWITITELADTLARDHKVAFKDAHTIAAKLIAGAGSAPGASLAGILRDVSKAVCGKEIVYTDAQLTEILSPQHFVEIRKTHGGPSPSETARALGVSKEALTADEKWLSETRVRLTAAEEKLRAAAADL